MLPCSQPPSLSSANLLGHLGLSAGGLKEDFVFVTTQKVLLISCAAIMYVKVVWPLMVAAKGKANGKTK